MCISCGCGMYHDNMGDERTVTIESLAGAALAMNQTGKEVLDEMNSHLKNVKAEDIDQAIEKMKSEGK